MLMIKTWVNIIPTKKLIYALIVSMLVLLMTSPLSIDAFAGLGGYISEKMLGDGTNEALYLGTTGGSLPVLGSCPLISTGTVNNMGFPASGATADLHGTITSLNGMPNADYWFMWGYTSGAIVNSTAKVNTAVAGDKSTTLTGFIPAQRIYYRFYASTDAETYGAVKSFILRDGRSSAMYLLWNILTAIIAGFMFILILKMSGNPIAALIGTIIGVIAIALIRGALESML